MEDRLLTCLQAIKYDRPELLDYLLQKKGFLPASELVNLMVNTKAIKCLELWLSGEGKEYTLITPYQRYAYCPSSLSLYRDDSRILSEHKVIHPLFELALVSDLVAEHLSKQWTVTKSLFREAILPHYPVDQVVQVCLKMRGLGVTIEVNSSLLDYILSFPVPDKRNSYPLKPLDRYYSAELGNQRQYPNYLECLLPDVGSPYDLFKNRLRSTDNYSSFLSWLRSGEHRLGTVSSEPVLELLRRDLKDESNAAAREVGREGCGTLD